MKLTRDFDRSLFGFGVPVLRDEDGRIFDHERPAPHEHTTDDASERLAERARRNGHTIVSRYYSTER